MTKYNVDRAFREEELRNFIVTHGPLDHNENLKIYKDYFERRRDYFRYFIERYRLGEKKVLEIGPAYGGYLIHMGPGSAGFETEEKIVHFGSSIGLEMRQFNAEEKDWGIPAKSFDVVMSMDTPLHMVAPFKLLLEARYVLNDKGLLLLQMPISNPFFKNDHSLEHFYTFTRKTLKMTVINAGFKIIEESGMIRTKPIWFNKLTNGFLKRWGPNLWIVAKKGKYVINPKSFRPSWISEKVWNQE